MDNAPICFIASFPNIQSAIRVSGDGGARILLDIPESELPAIARLLLMRGKAINVTIEDIPTCTELYGATEKEPKREAVSLDIRRVAKRRN